MVLTVTEDTPADMLAGSMELLVQLPREHHLHTQRVTVQRSTPMMDLLVQIATAHKLAASSYTLQAIGERGLVLPHQPNTPIGALDALQVKLLPKQGTFVPKKVKPANQPFETTFRLQVHLPRNQLYVSRVSPKMNLGEILDEVCREKNLDKHKYELRHPVNLEEILDLSLSLQDYHLQEVTLYAKQGRTLGSALSSQDIMALQRQEERRRQQAKQSVFGFMFKKSKESSVSTDSLEGRSVSPARSDETGRSASPLQPPTRPQRKRRPAPKPPVFYTSSNQDQRATTTTDPATTTTTGTTTTSAESSKEKMLIGHSRNSSDSSGYHEASVLSDNPDSAARLPETLPRRSRAPGTSDTPRKLAHTSHSSKSLGNLAATAGSSGVTSLDRALSSSSLSSTGLRKKRAAPPPPVSRPLSSAISTQALERIDDSEESLTSDMDPSKPPSDIGIPSKASSDIDDHRPKANSDIGISTNKTESVLNVENDHEKKINDSVVNTDVKLEDSTATKVENARVEVIKRDGEKKPLDTDALLHKVSETLSSSSLASPKEKPIIVIDRMENVTPMQKSENSLKQPNNGEEKAANTQNSSALSQQDTSDYVSALDDDLSVADWEYQLPAPPSAFRDSDSPVFDGYDTVTLRSVEAFKEPTDRYETNDERTNEIEEKRERIEKIRSKMMEPAIKLTKAVISELETKMGVSTLPRSQKEVDSKKIGNGNTVTPNIAPIDNHLSNFTITTYTRQKSLDIFDESSSNESNKNSEDTKNEVSSNGVSNESKILYKEDKELERPISRNKKIEPKITSKEFEATQRWQSVNGVYEKNNVQRSKSHASTMNKPKSKNEMQDCIIEKRHENSVDTVDDGAKKSTSVTNLNHVDQPRGNEKFSQWRENILKRQEEPTKEKQLQSLQVLKSILPQLTNTQRADENVSKEEEVIPREKPRSETTSNDNSLGPNVLSTNGESHVPARQEDKISATQKENVTKRYTYNGPPAISLGSWAERPTVKVQIKMDTDYKLGRDNVTGGTTIVNINGSKETNDATTNFAKNSSKIIGKNVYKKDFIEEERKNERKEHDNLTRKIITHTTASGFKKPSLNKVETKIEIPKNEDRPIVTAVELKKTVHQKQEVQKNDKNDNESAIDTTPLNFKELAKAFGQDINHRIKPQRANVNRHSDYYGSQLDVIRKSIEQNNKQQNGHAKPDEFPFRTNVLQKEHAFLNGERNGNNSDGKKFTSIVGINSQVYQNQNVQKNNVSFKNNVNNFKAKVPMPVVKGFKVTTPFAETKNGKDIAASNQNGSLPRNETSKVEAQPPKPPTMPVIMGVTLKSANARPKSTPVHVDSRDMLLESIRNFGGREKLRNTMERY